MGHVLGSYTSVGVDIGSSTSHLMFSRIIVGYPTAYQRHPEVLERKVISQSPISLTAFTPDWDIEPLPFQELVRSSFQSASLTREDIDTGAVIITGEAARRSNAQVIADYFSDETGQFVCATAGPRLEAILAAHGSRAVERSRDLACSILAVDMGGGTTKVARIERGRIVDIAVFNIGARILAFDEAGTLVRVEQAGRRLLKHLGAPLSVGQPINPDLCRSMAEAMAGALMQLLRGQATAWEGLTVVPFAAGNGVQGIDAVVFSGGVSEYIYGRESGRFGDLGMDLGTAVLARFQSLGLPVLDSVEGIRATVIGASQYTVQMSGETIHLPDMAALPIRNLRVFPVYVSWEPPVADAAREAVLSLVAAMDQEVRGDPYALAVRTPSLRGYGAVLEMARGLREALEALGQQDRPRALVFGQNVGGIVGKVVAKVLPVPYIDEIDLSELDFIDIGLPREGDAFVPVVVKSLIFDA